MKMVRVKLMLVAAIVCVISLLSACSGNGEGNNQPSGTPIKSLTQSTQKTQDKKEKTNAEKFLEYAIKAADLRNFTKTGNYAGVIKTLRDIYEDDIVNPYTGATSIYAMNRTISYIDNNDMSVTRGYSVDCVVIDDYMTQLKDLDTSEVVYCVNPESKGMVFAFWFMDGVYIYEIDENGQKINEIKHFFEKEE
ncbi:hypothetical protein M972_112392 [Acetivibrio thermocellus AD2]|uniref:Uncharacterized protein n=2 Tax=Acetivibrio thermocellus TaxID=1515 RepID=A0AB36TJ63_ACETH|nr:hypothetical protein Clo1313_2285 [Acetivibrio thermocellus DSM 1313]ALX09306.1 hypothetical protein AD2_02318 [Acetivibrio thermocellus AD2]ANV77058.1 hypothetical protein LQRI_2317 [Acetivibrio thermocellus DSM 2360]EIC04774.1 hypothetical protein YSBL_1607 [Acetivibrio thermocellus YS]SOD23605.1 hypothetical protein SAMN04515622_1220 [Acetivibrio thermocellus]